MLTLSPAAHADLLEISADGDVLRLSGPPVAGDTGPAPPRNAVTHSAALARDLRMAGRGAVLSPRLIEAVAWAESRFDQSARSPAGAIGVMQLMPQTAAALHVDATDAGENVRGGAAYLRQMLDAFDGDVERALAAYNAGPEAVRRYGGVPPYPETQSYVAAVLDYLARATEEGQ